MKVWAVMLRKRIVRSILVVSGILLAGALWQNIMIKNEVKNLNCPGQLINAGNQRMHILGDGSGSPTVLFTVGSGTPFKQG
jgi:hypothetical protein